MVCEGDEVGSVVDRYEIKRRSELAELKLDATQLGRHFFDVGSVQAAVKGSRVGVKW